MIKEQVKKEIDNCKNELVFIDCPLLFETDFYKLCDYTVVVYVDTDQQIRRLMQRDKINFPQALSKINAQMSLMEKIKLADVVIDNCHQESDLDWQIIQMLRRFN